MLVQRVPADGQLVQNLVVALLPEHHPQDFLFPAGEPVRRRQLLQGPAGRSAPVLPAGHHEVGVVNVQGQGPEEKGLLVGEHAVRPGAVEGHESHDLVVIGQVHGEGVVDVIPYIQIPVNGRGQPVLLPHDLAVPDHNGLGGVAHPQALVLVIPGNPFVLQGGEAVRQAEGVAVVDGLGLRVDLHGDDAGIGIGNEQLHLGQDGALELVQVPAGVDMVDHLVAQQKIVLFHGRLLSGTGGFVSV